MARTAARTLNSDIRPAIDPPWLQRFIEQVGVGRIINHVGIDRIIEHFGVKKLIKHIGLDRMVANLSAAERKELRRRLH